MSANWTEDSATEMIQPEQREERLGGKYQSLEDLCSVNEDLTFVLLEAQKKRK